MVISIWDFFLIFCLVMQDAQGNNSNYSVHFFHTSEMEAFFLNLFRIVFTGAHGLFNFLILLSLDISFYHHHNFGI